MTRYHITEKGNPGRCTAKPGNCPIGDEGEHFEDPTAAREAYEAKQESVLAGHKKARPQDDTQEVIDFVKAANLRVGDDYEGSPVTKKSVGSKWVTLATEAKPKILVPLDEVVPVQRTEATPEAQALEHKAYEERRIRGVVYKYLEGVDRAQNDLNESLNTYGTFRSHQVEALMVAQANREIAEQILSISENKDIPLNEAAEVLRESLSERFTKGYAVSSGLSRSTSVISNAMEDAKTDAVLNFLRDSWW